MTQQAPQEPAKRSMPYALRLVLTVVGVVAAVVIAAKMGLVGNGPTSSAAAPAANPATASAPAPDPADGIGDGVWLVGSDVQPGTYRSAGAVDGDYCMWSRHSSTSGGVIENIIASDGSFAGQMVVTIEPGDKLFRTKGCEPFQKLS